MKNFQETTEHIQSLIKLSDAEKRSMRGTILQNMQIQPSPYMRHLTRLGRSVVFRGTLAALIMTLIGGAGIMGVSAQALPGDTFYTTKLNLEEVHAVFKTSPASKIAFEIQRTENRFDEVRELVEAGTFDTTKQEIVTHQIEEHVAVVTEEVSKVAFSKEKNRTRVNTSDIKKSLEKEQASIATLIEEKSLSADITLSAKETDSLLALNQIITTTQEHVDTLEQIEETINEVLAETTHEDTTTTPPIETEATVPVENLTTSTDTPTPEESKIFVEKSIEGLKQHIETLYPPVLTPTETATLPEVASVMTESIESISPNTTSDTTPALEVASMATPTPVSEAEKKHTEIMISYDLLISAYMSENYEAAKALIVKLQDLLKTIAPVVLPPAAIEVVIPVDTAQPTQTTEAPVPPNTESPLEVTETTTSKIPSVVKEVKLSNF